MESESGGPEYITEWPPASLEGREYEKGARGEEAAIKRLRLEAQSAEELTPPTPSSLHLVQCSPSTKAGALLAQWWKEMAKTGSAPLIKETNSKNPNTKLFHISR